MTRCFESEFDVPEEQELQRRCVLRFFIYKQVADSPRVRKRMRPVTPGVPVHRDVRCRCTYVEANYGLGIRKVTTRMFSTSEFWAQIHQIN
jgi:hypothetical protein